MEETTTLQETPRRWLDVALVAILLVLAGGIHAWLMAHTTVAARDSIGYIRFALHLESQPWTEVLQKADQHPGYPLMILLVSQPVRHFLGGTTAETMVLSAQLASAIAGTLLVIPMFLVGRLLFDRRAGFWAALLFQCLPVSAHVIGDAISEATFFLFLTTSLLLAARALRDRSVLGLALCGVCGGLAYLTRPEGALAVFATLVVLGAIQMLPARRWPWRTTLTGAAALVLGALVVGGPYVATIGQLSPKPTMHAISDHLISDASTLPQSESSGSILLAALPAVYLKVHPYDGQMLTWWSGAWDVCCMMSRACQYVFWVPALLGLWWFRDRLRTTPGAWVVLLLCAVHWLILWRMVIVVGYVSERHALLFLLGCSFWAAAMLTTLVDMLIRRRVSTRWQSMAGVTLMLLITGFSLSSVLKPMHANRAGHRAAGYWIKAHADPRDVIHDPYAWAHFYAGWVLTEGREPPKDYLPMQWLVVEQSNNPHERLSGLGDVKNVAKLGSAVYTWEPKPGDRKQRAEPVTVYRYPPLLPGENIKP